MKIVIIVLLSGLIALPLLSWAIYGYSWEISAWFGLVAVLALTVIVLLFFALAFIPLGWVTVVVIWVLMHAVKFVVNKILLK